MALYKSFTYLSTFTDFCLSSSSSMTLVDYVKAFEEALGAVCSQ